MKKIYVLIAATAISITTNAQNKLLSERNGPRSVHSRSINPNVQPMAIGDTLVYIQLDEIFVNPVDNADFNIEIEDADGLPTNNAGTDPDWGVYISTDSSVNGNGNPTADNFFLPWEDSMADTATFWHATSWFNPAGTADNWLMFGPITLTAGGIVSWYDRTNNGFRDGYKLYATTAPSSPVVSADFTGSPFYTKTDASPSPTKATDTTWVLRTAVIPPAYESQLIYLAFRHTANDMDVLYLDEIVVTESALSINEDAVVNGVKIGQNSPNPFSNSTVIKYELEKSALVSLSIFDITGKKVAEQNEGNQISGKHAVKFNAEELPAGVYYYSLTVDKNTSSVMKMVVIK
ncbi:MAG: T9SS type A sorting domain-containing protein [Bacteroidetes bacterium]|nr:T9SS type A sorting domain-containing protein [Bacteroidota bacterium]